MVKSLPEPFSSPPHSWGRKGPPRTGLNSCTCRSDLSLPANPLHCSARTVQGHRTPRARDDSDHSSHAPQHSSRGPTAQAGTTAAHTTPADAAPLISARPQQCPPPARAVSAARPRSPPRPQPPGFVAEPPTSHSPRPHRQSPRPRKCRRGAGLRDTAAPARATGVAGAAGQGHISPARPDRRGPQNLGLGPGKTADGRRRVGARGGGKGPAGGGGRGDAGQGPGAGSGVLGPRPPAVPGSDRRGEGQQRGPTGARGGGRGQWQAAGGGAAARRKALEGGGDYLKNRVRYIWCAS